ncbi:hypothetical protein [Nonomuraea sp. LPB2021202275-12-8]|uniref:hypothetical protein n=1 Tax=Nonomuraea sp. LPB2021202275-12-8 TaxID=3120159 RepID=UPI00300CA7F3
MTRTREVHLAAKGRLEIVETVLEAPEQVLVRNRLIGLRAAMGLLLRGGAPGMPCSTPRGCGYCPPRPIRCWGWRRLSWPMPR